MSIICYVFSIPADFRTTYIAFVMDYQHENEKEKKRESKTNYPISLLAGVELEEAGEKWRAGDAVKSMRFFMRAIANYDAGLQKHPRSFDLAYNKYVIKLPEP